MTKDIRKEILERMIKANDEFTPNKEVKAYEYAECLMQLCNELEYKHAKAIYEYAEVSENAANYGESWDGNINSEEYDILENLQSEAANLYGPCLEGLKYFLGSDSDSTEFNITKA